MASEVDPLATIRSAKVLFETGAAEGVFTVHNGTKTRLKAVVVRCALLNEQRQPEDVAIGLVSHVGPGEDAYGDVPFLKARSSAVSLACAVSELNG